MHKSSTVDIPLVIVVSGPSGVGKDATLAKLRESGARFHYVVTATTRTRRPNETHGVDYFFLAKADFASKIRGQQFLEYAEVYDNYYGVLKSEVRQALDKGEDVIIKVDVQGAATLKSKIPDAVFVFLLPSSIEDLAHRLKKRNADSEQAVKRRLNLATEEMKKVIMFDYQVVNYNDNLDRTAETLKSIVLAEKCRVHRRRVTVS
jgi:guanylate kinase